MYTILPFLILFVWQENERNAREDGSYLLSKSTPNITCIVIRSCRCLRIIRIYVIVGKIQFRALSFFQVRIVPRGER